MNYTINTYALAQFTTALITLALLAMVWKKRHIRGGVALVALFSAIFWWALSAGFEAAATTRLLKIFWSKAAYIGAYFSPPFFLLFSLYYTNLRFKVTPLALIGLFVIPVVIVSMAFSNELHGLIWSGFTDGPPGTNSLIYEHGFFFWIGIVFIFSIVTLASLTLFLYSVKSQNLYKKQNRLIILAALFPITGTILYVSGLNPFPGLDLVPASFMFTCAALLVGISRQKLLDIIPISHEYLIDQFDDAVIVLDESRRVIDVNQSAEKLLRISRDDAVGAECKAAVHLWEELEIHIKPDRQSKFEIRSEGSDERYLQVSISPLRSNRSQFMGWIMVFEDITRRKRAEIELQHLNKKLEKQLNENEILQEKLREQAIRDALTGAFNRGYLDTTLQRELARAKRKGYPLAVMMIDIDHFKAINDNYGHKAGDIIIKSVGKMLMSDSRACDYVCRFGGDEFAVVMPEMAEADAVKRAEKWRESLKQKHVMYRRESIAPTISIGIAVFPGVSKGSGAIVDAADRALYSAKENGRDCVKVFAD